MLEITASNFSLNCSEREAPPPAELLSSLEISGSLCDTHPSAEATGMPINSRGRGISSVKGFTTQSGAAPKNICFFFTCKLGPNVAE